jgi:fatty acid desaturase
MRILLAFILGAWLAFGLVGVNPAMAGRGGAMALAQLLTLPLVIVVTVLIVGSFRHDRSDNHPHWPDHDPGRQ